MKKLIFLFLFTLAAAPLSVFAGTASAIKMAKLKECKKEDPPNPPNDQ